jgi:superfamily II RNA helicase
MISEGFIARPLFLRPAAATYAWATGAAWENTLQVAEVEEGIFASLILRTADNLRHIRGLRRIFPRAADSAAVAIDLIIRDPVAMFY